MRCICIGEAFELSDKQSSKSVALYQDTTVMKALVITPGCIINDLNLYKATCT